ncbi:hypothetical protein [Microbacterium oxydans]|uniref:hypothetical protein n=1 Tax=Microbacterium oxydans TaxID=82380 RepID=UPI00226B37CA|nr:hypothetical protein [Microbacterium oxydans]WAA66868.1 hypothetical protein MME74_03730 [Microbacterium oxydans]
MNDAQIWTMIGSFTALMFGMLTVVTTLFIRILRSEIGGLRSEMNGQLGGLRNEMNGQIGGLRNEMNGQLSGLRNEMNARFDAVNTRIDGLDRDVQAIVKRTFGLDRD